MVNEDILSKSTIGVRRLKDRKELLILGKYNLPTAISLLGLFFSFGAIIFSFTHYFNYAIVCLIFSGLSDFFDGFIARRLDLSEEERSFGTQIDSLIDIVSFGISPILFFLNLGLTHRYDLGLFFIYLSCAAIRLAHFNIHGLNESKRAKYFTGLPVTYAALIFPLVYVMETFVENLTFVVIVRTTFVIVSILFITKIPTPKPSGVFYVIFTLIAVLLTFYFLSTPDSISR